MRKLIDLITDKVSEAFEKAGYDASYGKVSDSIGQICVNISVMAQWQVQKGIIKLRL